MRTHILFSFAIEFAYEKNRLDSALIRSYILDEPNILDGANINPPDCAILENWFFER